ncbi:lipase class 3 [Nitzschia inconspicua]|uniref:Lipase class 3 n=1 Tax=Nitzschia inconspicua TaxID=303405 RepID=A0A9K3LDS6_9STRA|nr:lipase class 3 [Nitzschia inconspicua]
MPALVLFDQRTIFAGDDLRCCTKLHAIWRAFQLVVVFGMIGVHFYDIKSDASLVEDFRECQESGDLTALVRSGWLLLDVYLFSSIFLCLVSFALLASIHNVSSRGTPTDPRARRSLVPLCYFDIIGTNFLRCSLLIIGCLCIYSAEAYCECLSQKPVGHGLQALKGECSFWSPFITMLYILVGTHLVDSISAMLTLIYFTCRYVPQVKIVSSAQRCAIFLRCCFGCSSLLTCCLFGGRQAVLGDFAEFSVIIANYLNDNGILDLTPSDVLMGLDMVRRLRRQLRLEARERLIQETTAVDVALVAESNDKGAADIEAVVIPKPTKLEEKDSSIIIDGQRAQSSLPKSEVLSVREKNETYVMAEAAHFVVFAHAAYTWVSYVLENPVTGFCSLTYQILRQLACFQSTEKVTIKGDYIWRPHTVALELISGLSPDEIIYATFYDNADTIPYFIAVDHEWKTIVVAIRGTLTLESVFADIAIVPTELTEMGVKCGFDGENLYCHRGMLHFAIWVYEDLSRHKKLDVALAKYSGYRLRIVGHSLGAAVASILSVFLRPKYSNLRCLAFSPPGCTMSENLAEAVSDYIYSFSIDDDIIARMSIDTFEELRDSVLEMICRVKIPKYQVRAQARKFDLSTVDGVTKSIEETLYDRDNVRNSRFKDQVEEFWKFQTDLKATGISVKLCPPGSIVHFFRTRSNRRIVWKREGFWNSQSSLDPDELGKQRQDQKSRLYTPRWAKRNDFERIEISSHMLLDHDPIGVKLKIQKVAREQFALQDPFLWDELEYDGI